MQRLHAAVVHQRSRASVAGAPRNLQKLEKTGPSHKKGPDDLVSPKGLQLALANVICSLSGFVDVSLAGAFRRRPPERNRFPTCQCHRRRTSNALSASSA